MRKGQLEARLSECFSRFEMNYMGRGPKTIKTTILGSMIIVRMSLYFSPAEKKLIETLEGVKLFKEVRRTLFEEGKEYRLELLKEVLLEAYDIQIESTHMDISVKTGEGVVILSLSSNLEELVFSVEPKMK